MGTSGGFGMGDRRMVRPHQCATDWQAIGREGGRYQTGSGSVDQSIHELNWNIINLMRTYFDPNVLRQSWERWRLIEWDIRNILVEKIFAIPASRGLCFLCVIVARLKNERIFSASVAWNQIQAANRDQRKYAQKRNKHPLVFRGVKPKWLSAKPCSFLCQKNFSALTVDSSNSSEIQSWQISRRLSVMCQTYYIS